MKTENEKKLKQRLDAEWKTPPLPQGSRERFLRQLEKAESARRPAWTLRIAVVTAIAACLTGLIFWFNQPQESQSPPQTEVTIAEVRGYYKALMWDETKYIASLVEGLDATTREHLMKEVEKIQNGPDSVIQDIQKEPFSDSEKITYITQVYMSHLRSLQHIQSLLHTHQANLSK